MATEVAYYTYIYAKVDKKYYPRRICDNVFLNSHSTDAAFMGGHNDAQERLVTVKWKTVTNRIFIALTLYLTTIDDAIISRKKTTIAVAIPKIHIKRIPAKLDMPNLIGPISSIFEYIVASTCFCFFKSIVLATIRNSQYVSKPAECQL
uniref:Uncharacterized protein n=1 Tax=Glossina brevipalpis TaxID=37001 RepID=A0A1A9WGK8_9MUSC